MRAPIMAGVVATGLLFSATVTLAQVSDKPFQENWAPSKWGKDDAAGSSNHTRNPENIKRALSMIKQYKSVTLGKYYHREIPTVGLRQWSMVLPGTPNAGPFGENAMVYHDELVTTEIGQIGTQFDGPGHIGVNTSRGMFLSNGRMYPESYERGPAGPAAWARTASRASVSWASFAGVSFWMPPATRAWTTCPSRRSQAIRAQVSLFGGRWSIRLSSVAAPSVFLAA